VQIPLLRLVLAMAFGLGVGPWPVVDVSAQTFPDRPLHFIVPFPAGGATDAVARAMQPALEKILGQSVVVENPVRRRQRAGSRCDRPGRPAQVVQLIRKQHKPIQSTTDKEIRLSLSGGDCSNTRRSTCESGLLA
jgi:hypothetical protein